VAIKNAGAIRHLQRDRSDVVGVGGDAHARRLQRRGGRVRRRVAAEEEPHERRVAEQPGQPRPRHGPHRPPLPVDPAGDRRDERVRRARVQLGVRRAVDPGEHGPEHQRRVLEPAARAEQRDAGALRPRDRRERRVVVFRELRERGIERAMRDEARRAVAEDGDADGGGGHGRGDVCAGTDRTPCRFARGGPPLVGDDVRSARL
jgi:hypothetical protein